MAVAAQLFRLEQLDSEFDRLNAELADARRKQKRNPELEAAEKRLETLHTAERSASAEQRSLETELTDLQAKLKRDESRLYGGQIVDPRELASLEKELGHYRTQCDGVEDRLLEVMEQVESLQAQIEQGSREVNTLREHWEGDRQALARQAEETADALAGMRAERESLAAELPGSALSLYERLRSSSGHAVSTVSNGVCQWCRVSVPPKDVQHARAGSLVTCTNCSRILHVSHEH